MTEGPGPAKNEPPAPEPEPDGPEPTTPAPEPEPEPPVPESKALATESDELEAALVAPATQQPSVETTRRLLGASFDLLTRTSDDMRRASFYIGVVVLGTIGPLAIASFALEVVSIHRTRREINDLLEGGLGGLSGLLGIVAGLGLLVAVVESQAMAASILGGRLSGRPVTVRAAVARSRTVFWQVIVGAIIVAIPVGIAQTILDGIFLEILGPQTDVSFASSALAGSSREGPPCLTRF